MLRKLFQSITSFFTPKYGSVSAKEATTIISQKTHFILDVRTPMECANGKIKGAKNIPLNAIASRVKELEKYKNAPILVNCQSGARSRSACSFLTSNGFSNVTNLSGGVMALQMSGYKLS